MNVFVPAGVIPLGGGQSNVTIAASTSIILPTTAQRAAVVAQAGAFKQRGVIILEMWLTVKVATANFITTGGTIVNGQGQSMGVTQAPVVFVGEQMLLALRFIEAVAANGATISYNFFMQEAV